MRQRELNPTLGRSSPVKVEVLSRYLDGYDPVKLAYLVDGFTYGFKLESVGLEEKRVDIPNPRMPSHLQPMLENKLKKEIDADRIIGPFDTPPMPRFRVSPIKVAPKKDPHEYRFIHNLSYPYDEEAVNASIPRDKVSVQYGTVDDAISHIKEEGAQAYLAKTDIKSAFRIVPVHPSHYRLLGMQWRGQFYYDTTLPMGCSISCSIFEALSTALEWVARNKLGIPRMVHVLDDFLIIAGSYKETSIQLQKFLQFCMECGIPIAKEKTEGPASVITFLGITLDVRNSVALLPVDKLDHCRTLLDDFLEQGGDTQYVAVPTWSSEFRM